MFVGYSRTAHPKDKPTRSLTLTDTAQQGTSGRLLVAPLQSWHGAKQPPKGRHSHTHLPRRSRVRLDITPRGRSPGAPQGPEKNTPSTWAERWRNGAGRIRQWCYATSAGTVGEEVLRSAAQPLRLPYAHSHFSVCSGCTAANNRPSPSPVAVIRYAPLRGHTGSSLFRRTNASMRQVSPIARTARGDTHRIVRVVYTPLREIMRYSLHSISLHGPAFA